MKAPLEPEPGDEGRDDQEPGRGHEEDLEVMPVRPLLMILVSVVLGAGGQIALKHGMAGVDPAAAGLLPWLLRTFTTPFVLLGLACYAVSVTIWLAVLQRVDLSYAYPLADISKIVVLVSSVLLFGESPTPLRVVGTLVICAGAFLVARG